jgi:urease accessory protein
VPPAASALGHADESVLATASGSDRRAGAPPGSGSGRQPLQRAHGEGRITTRLLDGRTRLRTLYQDGAASIRLPHTHQTFLQAVLINTAGGLCGGDDLHWRAEAGAGARLVLTSQACERVYRSLGEAARVTVHLTAGSGARLDWMPQETILYEGARLHRRLDVDLADDACFCAVETFILGRAAMGEAAREVLLRDSWRIRRGGRLAHAEETRLSADPLERDAASLLAGAGAFGTVLYLGADAERRLEAIRALLLGRSGASVAGERLTVRAIAESGLALRKILAPIVAGLSGAGALPRLWLL